MNNQSNLALSSSMAWTYLKCGLHEKRPLKDLTFPKGVISGGGLLSKDARMTNDNLFRDFDFGPPIIHTIHTVAGLGDIQSHDTQPVSVQTDQTQNLEKDAVAPWSNLQLAKQNKVGWNPCFFWAHIGHILINETHHPLVLIRALFFRDMSFLRPSLELKILSIFGGWVYVTPRDQNVP